MTPEEARQRIASLCGELRHHDPRFALAAGILAGARPGRQPLDDDDMLEQATALTATGMSVRAACLFVARMRTSPQLAYSTSERLRRKMRDRNK